MFPGTYEFHWSFGRVLFLGLFFSVLIVIAVTVARAIARFRRRVRARDTDAITWKADFADLPREDRRCRHELAGELDTRNCPTAFDCRQCDEHPKFLREPRRISIPGAGSDADFFPGFGVPLDRYYHRGHTWARPEYDGTITVGLDELASRLVGIPDAVNLPQPGERVAVNGSAWRMKRNSVEVRVLCPVDGDVVATGGAGRGWFLKVRGASQPEFGHLLRGREAIAWMAAEVDRLQSLCSNSQLGATLADGGELVADVPAAMPDADWDRIYGAIFLQP